MAKYSLEQKSCAYKIVCFVKGHQLLIGFLLLIFGVLILGSLMLNGWRSFFVTEDLTHSPSSFDDLSFSHYASEFNSILLIMSIASLIAGIMLVVLNWAREPNIFRPT